MRDARGSARGGLRGGETRRVSAKGGVEGDEEESARGVALLPWFVYMILLSQSGVEDSIILMYWNKSLSLNESSHNK